jgi:diguanylate cyclase (GGDEF)-like protein
MTFRDAPAPSSRAAVDLAAAFRYAGTALVVTDVDLHIVAANPAYLALTGATEAELIGTALPGAQPGNGHDIQCEVSCRHRSGRERAAWMTVRAVTDARGRIECHVATFTDISEIHRERLALRHLAQHDALTQLPNRRLFGSEFERCIARARRHGRKLALLFIDLDHFKWINDTLGHAIGDTVLQAVGGRLRATVRAEDLVARWGGDEFVVVLEDPADADAVTATAALLLAAIQRGMDAEGHRLGISASIGVALFPDDAVTSAGLLRAGDAAMYQAKQQGRGRLAGIEHVGPGPAAAR